ncbi:alpha/beta fold hydrolase [Naasia lichenicola]|uniref:alpha/beta fold hydrolase n=1 Tax=Naasia lichenicola TaxID=2565933 RepID=UPI001E408080|nr:alpha/beta hydrolase [Naasia lichenicola]
MPASVVLVHGLRTSASMWRAQLDALDRAEIPARAIDLPGHGSRMAERFAVATAMAAIGDAVDAMTGPVILCGLSLGGYLSLHWAATEGAERIDGLIAAACGTTPRGAALEGYRRIAAGIGRLPDRGAGLNRLMLRTFVPEPGRTDVESGGIALDVMADGLREISVVRPIDAIGRIRVPILLVNGELDHFRLQERRYLAAARARPQVPASWSGLLVVPGASHLVSVTRPEAFSRLLLGAAARAD